MRHASLAQAVVLSLVAKDEDPLCGRNLTGAEWRGTIRTIDSCRRAGWIEGGERVSEPMRITDAGRAELARAIMNAL